MNLISLPEAKLFYNLKYASHSYNKLVRKKPEKCHYN